MRRKYYCHAMKAALFCLWMALQHRAFYIQNQETKGMRQEEDQFHLTVMQSLSLRQQPGEEELLLPQQQQKQQQLKNNGISSLDSDGAVEPQHQFHLTVSPSLLLSLRQKTGKEELLLPQQQQQNQQLKNNGISSLHNDGAVEPQQQDQRKAKKNKENEKTTTSAMTLQKRQEKTSSSITTKRKLETTPATTTKAIAFTTTSAAMTAATKQVFRYHHKLLPSCMDSTLHPGIPEQVMFLGAQIAFVFLQLQEATNIMTSTAIIEIPNRLYLGSSLAFIRLSDAIDTSHLQQTILLLSSGKIETKLVEFDDNNVANQECQGLGHALIEADSPGQPQVLLRILQKALRQPSQPFETILTQMLQQASDTLVTSTNTNGTADMMQQGICVQHLSMEAIKRVCEPNISCSGKDGRFLDVLLPRIKNYWTSMSSFPSTAATKTSARRTKQSSSSSDRDNSKNTNSNIEEKINHWVYYFGGRTQVPKLMRDKLGYPIAMREQLMSAGSNATFDNLLKIAGQKIRLGPTHKGLAIKELWTIIDYFMCRNLQTFVGNSIDMHSTMQIALKQGHRAYWYNAKNIPMSPMWRVFPMPIVYTYTESSAKSGKHLLQSSIVSVRQHMPDTPIHILYHGTEDTEFQNWLRHKKRNVIIHRHNPVWRDAIEEMRLTGDPITSHLFKHNGNYLGTWQRIDIPLFLDYEYVLLLDADTIINRPFTLADFGKNLTSKISMSSELVDDNKPSNAGVMVLNVPVLRATHNRFISFITNHTHAGVFKNGMPSDQGAYLEFYRPKDFLNRCFNFKPYYNFTEVVKDCGEEKQPYIIHFHGAKPHEYLKIASGEKCHKVFELVCYRARRAKKSLCMSFQKFARASLSVDKLGYCEETMKTYYNHSSEDSTSNDGIDYVQYCHRVMNKLATKQETCENLFQEARQEVKKKSIAV